MATADPILQNRIEPPHPEIGRQVPWKALVGGAAIGGLGLGAGYIGGGLISHHLLTNFPENALVRGFQSLSPQQQKLLLGGAAGLATGLGGAALLARTSAFGAHMQDASDDLNHPDANPKEAMVRSAYHALGVL